MPPGENALSGERGLLIRGASLRDGRRVDLRAQGGRIVAMAEELPDLDGIVLEAGGGLLLPGLYDHHIHLSATAAALASVRCGPPEVTEAAALTRVLAVPGTGWLRGIGYHESVAGIIDRRWLDAIPVDRPIRVQHRGGRLWILNSAALDRLLATGHPPPLGLNRTLGHLFDADEWLRCALASVPPPLDAIGRALAALGVSGVTEMSPGNDVVTARNIADERSRGASPQRVLMGGQPAVDRRAMPAGVLLGPVKLHLHEAQLPSFEDAVQTIRQAHAQERVVGVHCVTETELAFTLAALREAGARRGDRIEHASVAPDALLAQIAELGLAVVAQPQLIAERGDAYRTAIVSKDWPALYRLRAFLDAGVSLAGGSDAPFGGIDPWAAMAAAVERRTRGGAQLGAHEALTPEEALDLFLADPLDLSHTRTLAVGAPADFCLLDRPWAAVRRALSAERVRVTSVEGRLVYQRVDQAPV